MTNYSHGHDAEKIAADYLKQRGYKILQLNWSTRYCEIDIVAQKKKTLYFVEVKYRQDDAQGSGLDYITSKKLKQMAYAAEFWVSSNNWPDEFCLAAVAVRGLDYEITDFIEI